MFLLMYIVYTQLLVIITGSAVNWLDDNTNGLQKHNCPHSVPLWIDSHKIKHQYKSNSYYTFQPVCLEAKYFRTTCNSCSNTPHVSDWISGIECSISNGELKDCAIFCCVSESIRLSNCEWKHLPTGHRVEPGKKLIRNIRWQSLPIAVEICNVVFATSSNDNPFMTYRKKDQSEIDANFTRVIRQAIDAIDPNKGEYLEPFDPDLPPITIPPTAEIKGFKPPKSKSKFDFHCDEKHSPARINEVSLKKHNGMYCGNPYPCSDDCRNGPSCVMDGRRDDYVTDFDCVQEDNEEEPYKCNFTCCHSSVVRLHNCTWQYQTDGFVSKGNETEMTVRRVEFFPYIMEVCAVRKLNESESKNDNSTACGWGNYANVQPVQAVQPVQSSVINEVPPASPYYGQCSTMDIYFVVDSSHSWGTAGYANEISFLTELMGQWDFSPKKQTTYTYQSQPYYSACSGSGNTAQISSGCGYSAGSGYSPSGCGYSPAGCGTSASGSGYSGGCGFYRVKRQSASGSGSGSSGSCLYSAGYTTQYSLDANNRAGLITFSDKTQLQWDLTKYSTNTNANTELLKAAKALVYQNGQATNTLAALERATNQFEKTTNRVGVRSVVVLITDGLPTSSKATTLAQDVAKFKAVEDRLYAATGEAMYVATIGQDGLTFTNDYGIAADHSLNAATSSDLPGLAQRFFDLVCYVPDYYATDPNATPGPSGGNYYYYYYQSSGNPSTTSSPSTTPSGSSSTPCNPFMPSCSGSSSSSVPSGSGSSPSGSGSGTSGSGASGSGGSGATGKRRRRYAKSKITKFRLNIRLPNPISRLMKLAGL